jgi:hypothetical protein
MNHQLQVELTAQFAENSGDRLRKQIQSYNLGEEFNYAVVVLKLSITNGEKIVSESVALVINPQVHYIVPFINKELAEEYCKELSQTDKLMMLLEVKNGKAILDDDISMDVSNKHEEFSFDRFVELYDNDLEEYINDIKEPVATGKFKIIVVNDKENYNVVQYTRHDEALYFKNISIFANRQDAVEYSRLLIENGIDNHIYYLDSLFKKKLKTK